MIPQDKIDKAAEESHKHIKDASDKFFMKDSFKLGVHFAETELQNIAIEYGVWIETKNRYVFAYKLNMWKSFRKTDKALTPKEHFELFLSERAEK